MFVAQPSHVASSFVAPWNSSLLVTPREAVLPPVSPSSPSSQRVLTLIFSASCGLLRSLAALFPESTLYCQWLAHSFAKTPGGGDTLPISSLQSATYRLFSFALVATQLLSRLLGHLVLLRPVEKLSLYFQHDTNPSSRNPFIFTSIQNPPGCRGIQLHEPSSSTGPQSRINHALPVTSHQSRLPASFAIMLSSEGIHP